MAGKYVFINGTSSDEITYTAPFVGASPESLTSKLSETVSLKDFGAVEDGSTNDTTAVNDAVSAASKQWLNLSSGTALSDPVSLPAYQHWIGKGWTSENVSAGRPGFTFIKRSNGTQLAMTGNYSSVSDTHFDGNNGSASGDGVQVAATRQVLEDVSSVNQAGVGFRLGGAGATGVFNANIWQARHIIARNNTGDGVYVHHSGGTVTPQFPNGTPDVNAGVMIGADIGYNGGIGLHLQNAIDNVYIGTVCQHNTGIGVVLESDAKSNVLIKPYSESNNGGGAGYGDEGNIVAGAEANLIMGTRLTGTGSGSGWKDNTTPGKNIILAYDYTVNSGEWAWRSKFTLWNRKEDGVSTTTDFDVYLGTTPVRVYQVRGGLGGTTGGTWTLATKVDGGALTDRVTVDAAGDMVVKNQTNGTLFGGKTLFNTTQTGTWIDGAAGRINVVNSGAGTKTVLAPYDASGAAGQITTNGAGVTTYNATSDVRRKDIIGPITNSGPLIDAINVYNFTWKYDGSPGTGVIAQELFNVMPEVVHVGGDDPVNEPWGVDYSKLVPLLLAEVKSLRARVAELENK